MANRADVIRPFLFGVRLLLWISSIITLGLTAWVVDHLKGYRVVFTLVVAVLATVFYIPSIFTACMHRNRGFMLPLDIIFYPLWLSAFIFIAQTNTPSNGIGCPYFAWDISNACRRRNSIEAFAFLAFFWTLCGLCLEIANIYGDVRATSTTHPEKGNTTARGVSDANGATPSAGSVPAVNGEHTGV